MKVADSISESQMAIMALEKANLSNQDLEKMVDKDQIGNWQSLYDLAEKFLRARRFNERKAGVSVPASGPKIT